MARTTHVRVDQADKERLVELSVRMGITVPDVIHHLLCLAQREAVPGNELKRLAGKLEQEIDRLDSCISKDRDHMRRVEQWIGELDARLAKVERKLGIKAKRPLREGDISADMFCQENPSRSYPAR